MALYTPARLFLSRPGISLDSSLEHYVEKMFRRRESMSTARRADSGAAEGARRATEQSAESGPLPGAGRWSARRKVSVILELLRGADLESTSRKHRVTVATLTEWRER